MIVDKLTNRAVEPIRWTPSGRVQVRLRVFTQEGRPCGMFYSVPVFRLAPTAGESLASMLARRTATIGPGGGAEGTPA